MYRLAIDQGFTAEEWSAIKSGESDLAGSTAADTTAWPSRVPIINRLGEPSSDRPDPRVRLRQAVSRVGSTPIRSASSARLKYRTVTCAPYEGRWRADSYA